MKTTRLNVLEVAHGKSIDEGLARVKKICCQNCPHRLRRLTGIIQCSVTAVGHEPNDYSQSTNVYVVCDHQPPEEIIEIDEDGVVHADGNEIKGKQLSHLITRGCV